MESEKKRQTSDLSQSHPLSRTQDERGGSEEESGMGVERVSKNLGSTSKEVLRIVRRDHPELPGMVHELRSTVSLMHEVLKAREEATDKGFTHGHRDISLFLDLLRAYSATLAFYLTLKVPSLFFSLLSLSPLSPSSLPPLMSEHL